MTKPLTLDDLARALAILDWSSWEDTPDKRSSYGEDGISKEEYVAYARAILTTIKQAGYAIVPVEATEEMLRAVDDEDEDKFVARGRAVSAWQAMQSAAPQIEGD